MTDPSTRTGTIAPTARTAVWLAAALLALMAVFGIARAQAAPKKAAVSITVAGTGKITATATYRGTTTRATLTRTGTVSVAVGARLTLTASPASGAVFGKWTGACTSTRTSCVLSVRKASAIHAAFLSTTTTAIVCTSAVYTGQALAPCTASATGPGGFRRPVTVVYSGDTTHASGAGAHVSARFPGDAAHTGSQASGTFVIAKAPLGRVVHIAAKPFDGTTTAQISGCTLTGVIGTDDVACDLSGATASFTGAGAGTGITVTVTGLGLTGAAAGNYAFSGAPAPTTGDIIPAAPSAPQITNIPGTAIYGDHFTPVVSTTSDGATLVTSNSTSVCTVASGVVSYIGVGTCSLTASTAAGTNYAAALGTAQSFGVGAVSLTAHVGANNKSYDGSTAATISGCTLTGVIGTDDVACDLSGASASFVSALAGSGVGVNVTGIALTGSTAQDYELTSTTASTAATIAKAPPSTPTVTNIPTTAAYLGSFTPVVGTTGDGPRSVTSNSSAVCTVTGGTVHYVGVGTCSLTGHVGSGTNYMATDGTAQTFSVARATSPAPSITNLPSGGVFGGAFTPHVSATGDGGISVVSNAPTVCAVQSGVVNYVAAGTCSLTAHIAQGSDYAAADGAAQTFTISPATLTPVISNLPTAGKYGDSFTPIVSTTSDGATSVSSSSPGVCVVIAGVVHDVAPGTCALTAHVAAGSSFTAADGASQAVVITKATVTPHVQIADKPYDGTTAATISGCTLTGVVGTDDVGCDTSGATASFGSAAAANGVQVNITGLGLSGTTAADYQLAASSAATTANIAKATPSAPQITNLPTSVPVGGNFTAVVSTNSDGTTSVTSNAPSVCTVASGIVTYTGSGTCSLTAHVAAGTNYTAADGTAQSFSVGQGTPTAPQITNIPASATYGASFTPLVSTNGDGATSVTSNSTSVCTVASGVVSYVGVGTCSLTAHVAAGTNWGPSNGTAQSFAVAKATVTPLVTISDKPYDGTTAAHITDCTLTGVVGSDDVACDTSGAAASFASAAAANGISVNVTGLGLSGTTAADYQLAASSAATTANIAKATLYVVPVNQQIAYGAAAGPSYVFGYFSDAAHTTQVSPSLATAPTCTDAAYAQTLAAGTYTAQITCTGGSDPNYTFNTTAKANLTVTRVIVTPHVTITDKTYNGTTAAQISGCTLTGVLGTDVVTCDVSGAAASFASSSAAGGISVNTTGLGLAGAKAGDYQLTSTSAASSASITKATVTPHVQIADKPYDGTTAATISGCTLTGVVGTDDVGCDTSGATASFGSAAAANGVQVNITGLGLSGTTAADYQLAASSAATTANIAKATPSAPQITNLPTSVPVGGNFTAVVSTNSDGTTSVTSNAPSVCTVASGIVTYTGSGTCSLTAHVAAGTNYTAADGTAQSFSVGQGTPTAPQITNIPVTAIYGGHFTPLVSTNGDGATSVTSNSTSVCTVASGVVSYVGVGTCSLTAHVAAGTNWGPSNGTAQSFAVAKATVTPLVTISDKPYDGTTAAHITDCTLTGVVGSDDVACDTSGAAASFASAAAANGISVNVTGLGLSGTTAADYQLAASSAATTANIAKATLYVVPVNQQIAYGAAAGPSYVFGYFSDAAHTTQVSPSLATAPTCTDAAYAQTLAAGTYTAQITCTGGSDPNYTFNTTAKANLTVTRVIVTPHVTITDKTYNGTTAAQISGCTLTGVLGTDVVTCDVSGAAASFASSSAAGGISVNTTGLGLAGAKAGDYQLTSTSAASSASITKATVTPHVQIADKPYDGTTAAQISGCTLTGVVGTDDVGCDTSGATASFGSAAAANGVQVNITGLGLSGTTAADYQLAASSAATTANIAKATPSAPQITNLPTSVPVGGNFTAVVSTNSDGTTSVTSNAPSVCTVASGIVTYTGSGTCSLTAHVAAGTNYTAADGTAQSFSVGQGTPTAPQITNIPASATYGASFTPLVSTNGDGAKSVTSNSTSVCTVASGVVSYVGVGTCSLTARVAAGSNYAAADGSAQTFNVAPAALTPSISNIPGNAVYGGSFTPAVSTGGDGVTSVTSSTPAACTVASGVVHFVGGGQCTLTAHVAAGTNFGAADGTPQSFTITRLTPSTPSIGNVPGAAVFGTYFTPSVTTNGDGTTSVTSNTSGVCTVGGSGKVNFVGVGTCSLTAHVAAGTQYAAANGIPQSFGVGQAAPNVTIGNLPSSQLTSATYTPSVSTTGDGVTSVTSGTTSVCTVSAGAVSFVGVGTCALTAHVAAGTNYTAADGIAQSFSVTTGAVPLIVDTDMYSDAGDAGALSMAYALQQKGEANVVATILNTRQSRPSVATSSWKCAAAIAQFYGSPTTLLGSDSPSNGAQVSSPDWATPCGNLSSPSTAAPDAAVTTYRKALVSQPNNSVVIVSIGYFENLQALLNSPADAISPLTGLQLVQQKVKELVAMDGCFPTQTSGACANSNNPTNNAAGNPAAAAAVVNAWPTKIIWAGFEFGDQLHDGQTISGAQPATSPLRVAYEGFVGANNWIYSYDLGAVYAAVRPSDPSFSISGPGTNVINNSTGYNTYTPGAGNSYYLSINSAVSLNASIEALLDAVPNGAPPNETFDSNVLSPSYWSTASSGSTVAAANQELEITHPAGGWSTGTLQTQLTYDMTGKATAIQVTRPANGGQGASGAVGGETSILLTRDATHYVGWFIGGGGLGIHLNTGSGETNVIPGWVPYTPASMQWFRVRESGGTLYFEVAPGASSPGPWTTIQQIQDPFSLNGVRLKIVAGADTPAADMATFDNLTTG